MAFFLPPEVPPAQANAAELQNAQPDHSVRELKGLRLYLAGCSAIPEAALRNALAAASTPTDVVLGISRLLYLYKSFATRADYAMTGPNLYVVCVPLQVSNIGGTPALRPFFANLQGQTAPDNRKFEQDRVLADVYSQRVSYDSGLKLQPTGTGTVLVDALGVDTGANRLHLGADFSNAGNRFVGRNLLGAGLRYDDPRANEYRLVWKHALGGSSGTISAGSYDEAEGSWSSVGPSGLWQLMGHGFRYTQDLPGQKVDGSFAEGNVSWAGVAYADLDTRSMVQLRASYADRSSVAHPGGGLLEEQYAFAEPSLTYARLFQYDKSSVNLDASAALVGGTLLGDKFTAAASSIAEARVSFKTEWKSERLGSFAVSGYGQFAPRRLPEQMEVVFGGPAFLAGYLPGAVVGDSGAVAKLGWQRDMSDSESFDLKLRLYSEYGFARYGSSDAGPTPPASHGADVGIGLTAEVAKTVGVAADLAQPLSSSNLLDASRPGVYVTVTIHN